MTTQFEEPVNMKHCKWLLTISKQEFKDIMFMKEDLDNDGNGWDFNTYYNQIMKYLTEHIEENGESEDTVSILKRTYKVAQGTQEGRLYVSSFGLQRLQNRLRAFLSDMPEDKPQVFDLDICNSHPTVLLYLAKQVKARCSTLKDYVKNRAQLLSDNNVSKTDVIKMMNSDNQNPKWCVFLKSFHKELEKVKAKVNEAYGDKVTKNPNSKNPVSSLSSRIYKYYENEILQEAIALCKTTTTLMFDGFQATFINKGEATEMLKTLNSAEFSERYGITWTIKPLIHNIDAFDDTNIDKLYNIVKIKFEKEHYFLKDDALFATLIMDKNGKYKYKYYSENVFKIQVAPYQVFSKGNGKLYPFYDFWIKDPNRRMYETRVFKPYMLADTCPSQVLNTFEGFASKISKEYSDTNHWFFDHLFKVICKGDKDIYTYVMKYIAHIIQFPDKNPNVVIILRGHQGTGKDSLIDVIEGLIGRAYCLRTEHQDDIFGNFNEDCADKLLISINEADGGDSKKFAGKMKGLATSALIKIREKFKNNRDQKNYARMMINSNQLNPVPIEGDNRRFLIIQTSFDKIGDKEYFSEFHSNISNQDKLDNLISELAYGVDLSDFNPRIFPESYETRVQRYLAVDALWSFLKEEIDSNKFMKSELVEQVTLDPQNTKYVGTPTKITSGCKKFIGQFHMGKRDFHRRFNQYLSDNVKGFTREISNNDDKLKSADGCEVLTSKVSINGMRRIGYVFDLEKLKRYLYTTQFKGMEVEKPKPDYNVCVDSEEEEVTSNIVVGDTSDEENSEIDE